MRSISPLLSLLASLVAVLFLCVAPAWCAEIVLRASAVADPHTPLRLGDIAEISGEDAERLSRLVVVEEPIAALGGERWLRIGLAEVRSAMESASVSHTRHALSGSTCVVRVRGSQRVQTELPAGKPERAPEVIALSGPATVRTATARRLAQMIGVEPGDLRILFAQGQEELLARPLAGLTAVIRPSNSGISERLRVDVTLLSGERVVAEGTLRGLVQVRSTIAVVTKRRTKGAILTPDDYRAEERWLDPALLGRAADPAVLEGSRATNRLDPGEVLRESDIEPPLAVRRNDTVTVITVAGGISIETRARVLRDAVVGERVRCRLDRGSETFDAIVDAPGRVVVLLDSAAEASAIAPESGTPDAKSTVRIEVQGSPD